MLRKRFGEHRELLMRCLSVGFTVGLVAFLALYLKDIDFSMLKGRTIQWKFVVIGSAIGLVFRYWMVIIWRVILRSLGARSLPSFALMSSVYAKAWLARYIPGTVTWIVGKIAMASKYGISKSKLAVSSLLEAGMQVAATAITSLLLLGVSGHAQVLSPGLRVIAILGSFLCLAVLFPPVFNHLLRIAYSVTKKKLPPKDLHINNHALLSSFALFVVGTLINGTSCYFVVRAIDHHAISSVYFYIVGSFGLAGALGMITPFLPSGLGVRDGVLLIFLAAIMPKELALVITVFTRLWQIALDVLFYGTAVSWSKLHERRSLEV